MTISQEQIAEIARAVWSSFLDMPVRELEPSESSTADDWHSASATVHITGSWNGSVILSCSTTLARKAASAMFEIGEDDVDDGEVADAFGELVNIIGGNLKCLLPEPSQLSLPTVSQGAAHVVTVPGAGLMERVELDCEGERLHIAVWDKRTDSRLDHLVELQRTVR
jgi:chemotaxis protein CheX